MSFSDTMCPSCAERVRIERLWGTSPPTPVWPALIFVGLPLLTALVLLATPLHDAAPPPAGVDAPPRRSVEAPATEPRLAQTEVGTAAMPRALARRQPVSDDVPAVIYETGRRRPRAPVTVTPSVRGSAPAVVASHAGDAWLRPASTQSP